jgi:hypothetical protein
MRFLSLMTIAFIFSGCVGISTFSSDTKHVPFNPELTEGTIYGNPTHYTKDEVLSFWGEPSKKSFFRDNRENWLYRNRLGWNGIILWAIIPIPLFVPIGSRETTVSFDNNLTVNTLYEYARETSTICGPFVGLTHGASGWCNVTDK